MTSKAVVDEFMAQKTLAVVGVSRRKMKFGNMVYKELKRKGYRLFPVNPNMETYDGVPCHPDLESLPETPGGAVVVVPPPQTLEVARGAFEAGIKRLWMQQGAESPAAVEYCREHGIEAIHGECILMFAEPRGLIHNLHYKLWNWLGKTPA